MNRFSSYIIVVCFFMILWSCKKENTPSPSYNFGKNSFNCVLIRDSTISSTATQVKVYTEFVALLPDLVADSLYQGDISVSDLEFETYSGTDYTETISNIKKLPLETQVNHSTLLLLDVLSTKTTEIDDCLLYTLDNVSSGSEFMVGSFAGNSTNTGYELFSDEFITGPDNNEEVINKLYSSTNFNPENPINAASNAIDYIVNNAKNPNMNIVLFIQAELQESDNEINTLIAKANAHNVSISIIAPHDWKNVSIPVKTGGFHCNNYFNNQQNRTLIYSLDKLLSKKYYKISFDETITYLNGTVGSWIKYYLTITNVATDENYNSNKLYSMYY